MKCPNCGFENVEGAKFCSECAYKLSQMPADISNGSPVLDEKLSNELMELWKLYETDQLYIALQKVEYIKKTLSGASSVCSLAALIYEKRAKKGFDNGNLVAYYDDLASAAREYEEVLKQNPNSAADRAKLLAIRHKLIDADGAESIARESRFTEIFKRIPLPIWAAAAVFVLIIVGALLGRGFSGKNQHHAGASTPAPVTVAPPMVNRTPQTPLYGQAPMHPQQSGGGVYTFPYAGASPSTTLTPQAPVPPRNNAAPNNNYGSQNSNQRTPVTVRPLELPSIQIVPSEDAKQQASSGNVSVPQIQVSPSESGQNAPEISVRAYSNEEDSLSDDANTWLARAIEFEKQGQYSYARAAAERAQKDFLRNLADGKNKESSANGIELTKSIIRRLDSRKP